MYMTISIPIDDGYIEGMLVVKLKMNLISRNYRVYGFKIPYALFLYLILEKK